MKNKVLFDFIIFFLFLLIFAAFYFVLFFIQILVLGDNNFIFFSVIINVFVIILCYSNFRFIDKILTLLYLFFMYGFVLSNIFFYFVLFLKFFGIFAGKALFILIFYEIWQAQRSSYFKFNRKVDIIKETPYLLRCKVLAGMYVSIYVCYLILSKFVFIPFYVKILLFLGFCGTVWICYCEIVNYLIYDYGLRNVTIHDFVLWGFDFCLRNWAFTVLLLIIFCRIMIQIVYEILNIRYALPGGMWVCGEPGMIANGNLEDKIPSFDNLISEELQKLVSICCQKTQQR